MRKASIWTMLALIATFYVAGPWLLFFGYYSWKAIL